MSLSFIPVLDYRPDHQIAFATVWTVFAAAQAHFGLQRHWYVVAGLLASLSQQLHAIGIALVFALGIYYVAALAFGWLRDRRVDFAPLFLFGLGATVGGTLFFVFNVLPAGGLSNFLTLLVGERGARASVNLVFLTLPSLLDGAIVVAGFTYAIWRRGAADRFLLGMTLCLWVALAIVDTQGYRTPTIALYAVPVGALVVSGLAHRQGAAAACAAAALFGQLVTVIPWSTFSEAIQSRQMPTYVYGAVGEQLSLYLRDDDKILTTHLLIWGLHDRPDIYTYAGEVTAQRRWQLDDPAEVWERVAPTVVIDVEGQMSLNSGAQTYMRRHDFQICDQLEFGGLRFDIYRPDC